MMFEIPKCMVIPKHYIEIDATRIPKRLLHLPTLRISTREKFRRRRLARKMRKMLMENFRGQPLNDDTRDAVKAAIMRHFGHWKW